MTVSCTTITDKGKIELALSLHDARPISIQGASSSLKGPITNLGTLEVTGAASLLNDTLTNTGHIRSEEHTSEQSPTYIVCSRGPENNNTPGGSGGLIDVTGDSTIDGGAT